MTGAPPIAIVRDGHRTLLKWHRARRRYDDAPFTAQRIREGMQAGASLEVDLRIHRERGFALLHDDKLRHDTDGRGKVARTSAAKLRTLQLRDPGGRPTDHRVLLLDDLPGLFARVPIAPSAVLQLDFKQDAKALDERSLTSFATATAAIAPNLILSCGDAEAVRILTDAVPAMQVGYDPCHRGAVDRVLESGAFAAFVDDACAASPRATTIYLEIRLVLAAAQRGTDLVAAFAERGRTVDAYTFPGQAHPSWRPTLDELLNLRIGQLTVDDPEGIVALLR